MKKLIILIVLCSFLVPVKAQLFGNRLANDSIFISDITGPDTVYVTKLRAPQGVYIWYEFDSFANNSTARITCGPSVDGVNFQTVTATDGSETSWLCDSTHVGYNGVGDTIKAQSIWIENMVGLYWMEKISKGSATNDTIIRKINR